MAMKVGAKVVRHGMLRTRTHYAWISARHRCHQKNDAVYDRYGGRGIRMCAKWRKSFLAFLKDMGPCPSGLTLERIDNDGNYEPGNCKWATVAEQNRNRRNVIWVEFEGEKKILMDWARDKKVNYKRLNYYFIQRGFRFSEALKKAA